MPLTNNVHLSTLQDCENKDKTRDTSGGYEVMKSGMSNLMAAVDRLSVQDTNSTSMPTRLLSLPRELRDQIYARLLFLEHTRAPPYHERDLATRSEYSTSTKREASSAHTYRFHTSILGTNRQIQKEASEMLASNHFVVVSFCWKTMEIAKHHYHLPIVCEDQKAVARFKHYSLRVGIIHGAEKMRSQGTQSFIMLAADLPLFCGEMMQWSYLNTGTGCTVATAVRNSSPHTLALVEPPAWRVGAAMSVTIQVLTPADTPMQASRETWLLRPFEGMIIKLQKVTIFGCLRTDKAKALAQYMSPQMVFLKPMAWRAADVALKIKHRGDDLVRTGDIQRAIDTYQLIAFPRVCCPLMHLPEGALDSDTELPVKLLLQTIMDAVLTMGFLQLRLGKLDAATRTTVEMNAIREYFCELPPIWANRRSTSCCWLATLTALLCDTHTLDKACDFYAHLFQDLDLLEKIQSDNDSPNAYLNGTTSVQDLIDASSLGRSEPLIFETPRSQDCHKPEGMRGFVDCRDYERCVAANPKLNLMGGQELDRMFKALDQ
ncbi:hypothetical protein LTR08_003829 [Meristemomyces frigidus]|nr:hypothetical protein LTR08_003829 [Meristemomyces frigidus]